MLSNLVPIASELKRVLLGNLATSGELARLQKMDDKTGPMLAEVFRGTIDGRLSEAEARYVSQIEGLRNQLENSVQDLEIHDFGAQVAIQPHGRIVHMELGNFCRGSSRRPVSGLMLMKLLEALQPKTVLEFGSSVGISASYQAAALEINGRGRLYTLEGAPAVASVASGTLAALGFGKRTEVVVGRFVDTLPGVLQRIGEIDFAFIDGHHDYSATLDLFEQIKPSLSASAVVMFDDISWSPGMVAAWKKIIADPQVGTVVDLYSMGLCILHGPKQAFRIALPRTVASHA